MNLVKNPGVLHPLASSSEHYLQTNKHIDIGHPLFEPPETGSSSSMDGDGTESGSDSERFGVSLPTSPKSTEASTIFSGDADTEQKIGGNEVPQDATSSRGQEKAGQNPAADIVERVQQQHRQQNQNPQGLPRPMRRALFPSQLPPDEDQKLPIRPNAEECLFYIHTGWCGYGSGCRYNHPPEKMALHKPKAYNSLGLPLREGVQDCQYFMRVATCKFGATCKFNHPQHVVDNAVQQQQQQQQQHQQLNVQQAGMMMPPLTAISYPSAPTSPAHISPRRSRNNSSSGNLSASASPVLGPSNPFAIAPPSPAGAAPPFAAPYIVYYVQPTPEPCWQFMTTGRCQLGHQCPFLHQ